MRLFNISRTGPGPGNGTTPREVGGSSSDIVVSGNMSFPGLDVEGSVLALIAECPPPEPPPVSQGFLVFDTLSHFTFEDELEIYSQDNGNMVLEVDTP
jgi:hypothetical protein